jgi:hypothetical protein
MEKMLEASLQVLSANRHKVLKTARAVFRQLIGQYPDRLIVLRYRATNCSPSFGPRSQTPSPIRDRV